MISDAKVISRFMKFVKMGENPNDCWRWLGFTPFAKAYGRFQINRKALQAHEVSYRIFIGPVPDGHEIRHNRPCKCVNPWHLMTGTKAQNIGDQIAQGTIARGEACRTNILTEEQVKLIRSSRKTSKELSTEFNVSMHQIRNIICRRSWSWLA